MNELEVAIKYGVTTYETSKTLDWRHEARHYWYKGNLCDRLRFNSLVGLWFALPIDDDGITFFKSAKKEDFIPAPQINEIAPLLPLFIMNDTGKLYVNGDRKGQKVIYKNYLNLSLQESELEYCTQYDFEKHLIVKIQNYHFAQAYAELYLKVKSAGLLEKEGQNG